MIRSALSMNSGLASDTARCLILISISLISFPISLGLSIISIFTENFWSYSHTHRQRCQSQPQFRGRRVLITGVGMAKGLTIARTMYLSGHYVVGADFEDNYIPCSGRFSKAISKFFRLSAPKSQSDTAVYVQSLTRIIRNEKIDVWISCSGVASAIEDTQAAESIETNTNCKCVQFDVKTTAKLHEKDAFIEHTSAIGLPVPETHNVTSHMDIYRILLESSKSSDRKFILKPVAMNDRYRADMTLLPFSDMGATHAHVSSLPVTEESPWILQQYIPGGQEYCTHALVVQGQLRVFVACPSADLLMHYRPLPADDSLSQAMLAFTRDFIARSIERTDWKNMTGHLSFDFMCEDKMSAEDAEGFGSDRRLFAIECNPRAHTAVVLFAQEGNGEMENMANAYLSVLDKGKKLGNPTSNGSKEDTSSFLDVVSPTEGSLPRYWIGHDIIACVLFQLWSAITQRSSISLTNVLSTLSIIPDRLAFWKEGTFEFWDPLPFLVLYHLYWPATIFRAWWHGNRWSRANVSTTKMFAC